MEKEKPRLESTEANLTNILDSTKALIEEGFQKGTVLPDEYEEFNKLFKEQEKVYLEVDEGKKYGSRIRLKTVWERGRKEIALKNIRGLIDLGNSMIRRSKKRTWDKISDRKAS